MRWIANGSSNLLTVAGHLHSSVSTLRRRLRTGRLVFEPLIGDAGRTLTD